MFSLLRWLGWFDRSLGSEGRFASIRLGWVPSLNDGPPPSISHLCMRRCLSNFDPASRFCVAERNPVRCGPGRPGSDGAETRGFSE